LRAHHGHQWRNTEPSEKQKKKVSQVMWKVFICIPFPEKIFSLISGCSIWVCMLFYLWC